ncbi:MAG: hypothetical protein U0003_02100 [Vampirovibrionales bacterium]
MILKIFVALGLLSTAIFLAYRVWKVTVQWRGSKQAKGFFGGLVFLIAGLCLISLCSNGGVIQLQCDSQRCVLERQNILNQVVSQENMSLASVMGAEPKYNQGRYGTQYHWVLNTVGGNKMVSSGSKEYVWGQAVNFQRFLKNTKRGFSYRQDLRWQNICGVVAGLLISMLGVFGLYKVTTSTEHF